MPGRGICTVKLEDMIADALCSAIRVLDPEVERAIVKAASEEKDGKAAMVFDAIVKNIAIAKESGLPLCQDTGMFWCLVEIGRSARCDMKSLDRAILDGMRKAQKKGFYRKSVVEDPVFERRNTGCNLPGVVNYRMVSGRNIDIYFLLKGFGSENCSSVRMLNPTSGRQGVIDAVLDMVKDAGGKPCPPMFLGIGIGGTLDRAALLSKKALVSPSGKKEYRMLSKEILTAVNELGIGAGGLGGSHTALYAGIAEEPTHIAGLPVALTVNCWADRKVHIVVEGGFDEKDS